MPKAATTKTTKAKEPKEPKGGLPPHTLGSVVLTGGFFLYRGQGEDPFAVPALHEGTTPCIQVQGRISYRTAPLNVRADIFAFQNPEVTHKDAFRAVALLWKDADENVSRSPCCPRTCQFTCGSRYSPTRDKLRSRGPPPNPKKR